MEGLVVENEKRSREPESMADNSDKCGWEWEERLDIDDSDLFSTAPSISSSSCPLRPCSSRSTNPLVENPSSVSPRLLPGPAGAVQAAMHRINVGAKAKEKEKGSRIEDIGRVGGYMDLDSDFQLDPWICAMQCLGTKVNSVTPIASIRTDSTGRIPMVVGLVKSCTPNGLGDLVLTLKDQTGTISASIHNKALLEGTLGSDVAVGCVLILKQLVGKNCRDSQELPMSFLATKFQDNGKRERNKQMERALVNGLENHAQVEASAIHETRIEKVDSCEIISRLNPKVNEVSRKRTNDTPNHYLTRTVEQSRNSQNILRKIPGDALFCKTFTQNTSVTIWKDNLEPNKENEEKEKLSSKVLIPEWTDEQLSELFAEY